MDICTVWQNAAQGFLRAWQGNEMNTLWADDVIRRKQKWSSGVREHKDDIVAETGKTARYRIFAALVFGRHQGNQPRADPR